MRENFDDKWIYLLGKLRQDICGIVQYLVFLYIVRHHEIRSDQYLKFERRSSHLWDYYLSGKNDTIKKLIQSQSFVEDPTGRRKKVQYLHNISSTILPDAVA